MGMIGNHFRLASAELSGVLADPGGALPRIYAARDAYHARPIPAESPYLSLDKAWHVVAYLLTRSGASSQAVFGAHPLPEDVDWGMGPPAYLTAAETAETARVLAELSFAELTAGTDPAELETNGIYPQIWTEPSALEWASARFAPLPGFFAAAAAEGQAVLAWID